nr:ribonuclease H-like domain-containing protein [Tanacetum cinerariifolium]
MDKYIRLKEGKARRHGKVYNWVTAMYGKIWNDEDVYDLKSVETEFPAIVFNVSLTTVVTLTSESTVSPLNDNKIDFRISFDESDNEHYTGMKSVRYGVSKVLDTTYWGFLRIITTVSNNNEKFPYLKKDEYELISIIWMMQGVYEMPSKLEGLHKGYDRMQKIISQLNQLNTKPEDEDINLKFLRALPSSWSQVALTLKTKGGLELLSFDDLYYKLKTLEVDVKGYTTFSSSQFARPSHSAFVSATSAGKKMSYGDSPNYSSITTYSVSSNSKTGSHGSDFKQIEKLDLEEMDLKWQMAMLSVRVHKFEQKARRKIDFDKKESATFNKKKVRCYKCQQRGHFAIECRPKGGNDKQRYSSFKIKEIGKKEEDSKALITVDTAKGGNDKQRYSSFKIKEIGKKEEDSKALITVDTLVDWTNHDGETDEVIASKEFGMIAGCDTKDAIKEGAAKIYNFVTRADTEEANTADDAREFALMGVTSETAKKDLQTKLDSHLVQTEKWRNSSKNLFRLIDSSMSVRIKVGLGFNNFISENELGWDDSAFSVFSTNSKDVEGRPLFYRFAKADSMKAVPSHLSGDYTSLSDHNDLDELQISYGTKSSTSSDYKSMSNDFVSCDDSDKSSEVNSNDFASNDSSVKYSDPKPNDSTSCASTSN